jgi:hypothetical protein
MDNKFAVLFALKNHFGHDNFTIINGIRVLDETTNDEFIIADLNLEYSIGYIRQDAIKEMRSAIDTFVSRFIKDVPVAEMASWPEKAALARGVIDGKPSPAIEAEAAIRGVDPVTLSHSIVNKADIYSKIIGMIAGLRSVTEAAIGAANSKEEIEEILQSSKIKAIQMAGQFGLPFP